MGVEDYAAWCGRREFPQSEAGEHHPDPPHTAEGISLDFEKRAESTTLVQKIRLALFKNRMGE